MDRWKRFASAIAHSGLLGIGLLGTYFGYKQRIPDLMCFASYGVTFIGIYILAAYLLDDEFEDSDNSDMKLIRSLLPYLSATPKVKRKNTRIRRAFLKDFDKKTKWVFEKRGNEPDFAKQPPDLVLNACDIAILSELDMEDLKLESLLKSVRPTKTSTEVEGNKTAEAETEESAAAETTVTEFNTSPIWINLIERIKLGKSLQMQIDENPSAASSSQAHAD